MSTSWHTRHHKTADLLASFQDSGFHIHVLRPNVWGTSLREHRPAAKRWLHVAASKSRSTRLHLVTLYKLFIDSLHHKCNTAILQAIGSIRSCRGCSGDLPVKKQWSHTRSVEASGYIFLCTNIKYISHSQSHSIRTISIVLKHAPSSSNDQITGRAWTFQGVVSSSIDAIVAADRIDPFTVILTGDKLHPLALCWGCFSKNQQNASKWLIQWNSWFRLCTTLDGKAAAAREKQVKQVKTTGSLSIASQNHLYSECSTIVKGKWKKLSLSLSSFCNSKWGKDMCPLASCHAPSRDWTDVPKTLLNTSWIILLFWPDFCHLSSQAAVLSEVVCSSQHHIPVGWSTWSTLSLAFESCLVFLLFEDLWSTMRLSSPHPAGPRMHTES